MLSTLLVHVAEGDIGLLGVAVKVEGGGPVRLEDTGFPVVELHGRTSPLELRDVDKRFLGFGLERGRRRRGSSLVLDEVGNDVGEAINFSYRR